MVRPSRHVAGKTFSILAGLGLLASGITVFNPFPSRSNAAKRAAVQAPISVFAAGRGTPFVNLTDGRPLDTVVRTGDQRLVPDELGELAPLGLARADFDLDGVSDLVATFHAGSGGVVKVYRGNVDALYPNTPEAEARRKAGTFTDEPFPDEAAFRTPEVPDFVGAGDFNNDGHADVVIAARGGNTLRLLAGDGKGGLVLAESVELSGSVTAFADGEINRRDGLADIAVGVGGATGPRVLVFQCPNGAIKADPEVFGLASPPVGLAVGDVNLDGLPDLAVAAGSELTILRGRNRESVAPAEPTIDRHGFDSELVSVAFGRFVDPLKPGFAVLTADGAVEMVDTELKRVQGSGFRVQGFESATSKPRFHLAATKTSSLATDDLLVLGPSNRIDLFNVSGTFHASLSTLDAPRSILPMRLNGDALDDLVVLQDGERPISRLTTQPNVTITVNSALDGPVTVDGNVTLREAITAATTNAPAGDAPAGSPGLDTITFGFGAGTTTISPTSALPTITDPVTIDTTTIAGQLVEVNGAGAGAATNGFQVTAGGSAATFRGLTVRQFGRAGIFLNGASNCLIEGCRVGTNAAGTATAGNLLNGVTITNGAGNTVGGTVVAARNLVSGNANMGIAVSGATATGNRILGNFVGTDVTGALDFGNTVSGIQVSGAPGTVIGGSTPTPGTVGGNVSSGSNFNGIIVSGEAADATVIQGNILGLNATGTAALSNPGGDGVRVDTGADATTIGGSNPTLRNIISGNGLHGVRVRDAATDGTTIQGNYIGTDITGALDLGNTQFGIEVSSPPNTVIGGPSATPGAPPGNVVSGNNSNGIEIVNDTADGTVLRGNIVGLNAAGTAALGNGLVGIAVGTSADNATIGGPSVLHRNVVSGNGSNGVSVSGSTITGVVIQGNYVGTDITGTLDLGNGIIGINISDAPAVVIGGPSASPGLPPGNVVSGNDNNGIQVSGDTADDAVIRGNIIGLTAAGTAALGNTLNGIDIQGSADSAVIGGPTLADRNLVSANGNGIVFRETGTTGGQILGNYVGTDITGMVDFGNGGQGVSITDTPGVIIGDGATVPGAPPGNVISGNGSDGIQISTDPADNCVIRGNVIGLNATGTTALGNSDDGVNLRVGATGTIIGGTAAGQANLISGNTGNGILIEDFGVALSSGTQIQGNFIGTNPVGTSLPNGGDGVEINASGGGQVIGGTSAAAANVIAFNGGNGVLVRAPSNGNPILTNSIHSNGALGIDLIAGNQSQPVPTITSVSGLGVVQGTAPASGTGPFRIQIFGNPACDASGSGEGRVFLGETTGVAAGATYMVNAGPAAACVTLTATATSAVNNTSEFSLCFSTGETVPPQITTCPAAQTVPADADCLSPVPDFTPGVAASDNCTPAVNLTITQNPTAGTQVGAGTTSVTIIVRDFAGNTATCLTSFTVTDAVAPIITTCPAAQTVSAGPTCQAPVPNFVPGVVASDNCTPAVNLTITQSPTAGTQVGLGTTPVTITVRDSSNNPTTCMVNFTVNDTTPPQITTCPPSQTANADADCLLPVPNFVPGVIASDNCTPTGSLTITQSPTAGTQVGAGTTAVTITVTDQATNQTTCTVNFTVIDTVPPQITTCPAAQTVSAGPTCQAQVPNFVPGVVASDNCTPTGSLTITQNPTAGTLVGLGVTTVTITVRDQANNSTTCQTSVTVNDTTPPTITTCPAAQTANADADCLVPVPNFVPGVVASDNCTAAGSLTITQNPLAGTQVGPGATTVTITVRDQANNQTTCQTSFTVTDVTPPQITTCPAAQTANADADCLVPIPNFVPGVIASDNCTATGSLTITQNPTAGTEVGTGTTTVTITVADAANNQTTCQTSFTVTDVTPPAITTCPAAQTTGADAGCMAQIPNFVPGVVASDNCTATGTLTITQNPLAGTQVGLGTTTVTITVRDQANNSTTCQTGLTVVDMTPPSIMTCPAAQTANADADCLLPIPNFVAGVVAFDNCTPTGTLTITQNPLAGTQVGLGATPVTITVTDAANNQTTCMTAFTVVDVTPPVITFCPPDQTVPATGPTGAVVTYPPAAATDNCTASPTITYSQNSGTLFPIGATVVTVTATDASNNSTTCTFTVTVSASVLPILYVADTQNHRIQKFDGQTWSVICGRGVPGIAPNECNLPEAVTADFTGMRIYVADRGNNRVTFSTDGGATWAVFASGPGLGLGQVSLPQGVALDVSGNLYVADTGNNRVLRFAGGVPGTGVLLANFGTGAGQVKSPRGLAVDNSLNLYVADRDNNRILKIAGANAVAVPNTGATVASGPGIGLTQVTLPEGVAVDDSNNLYVADTGGHRVLRLAGGAGPGTVMTNGPGGLLGLFNIPEGVTVSRFTTGVFANQLLLAVGDTGNNRIQGRLLAGGPWQPVGAPNTVGSGTGQFRVPSKIR